MGTVPRAFGYQPTQSRFGSHSYCVFVCFLPIHSGHQVRWTYQPGSHRRKVTQDFSIFLLRCVPSFFSREGFSHSFPSSTVKLNFVYQRFNRSPLVRDFIFIFYFFSEKNPVYRDQTHVPTCQRVTRLPLSYRGDRLKHFVCCCCCCFSHSAYWLPTRKNYFTRWPIPLVVC